MTTPDLTENKQHRYLLIERLVEFCVDHHKISIDRTEVLKLLDAVNDEPDETTALIHVCQHLNMRWRSVGLSKSRARQMLDAGFALVFRTEEGWIGLAMDRKKKLRLLKPHHGAAVQINWQEFEEVAKEIQFDDPTSNAIVTKYSNVQGVHDSGEQLPPIKRVLQLFQPEFSEIGIIAIFALITGILAMATPIAVESLVNTVAFGRFLQPVIVLALLLFGFLAFSAAIIALQTFVVELIQRRLFARVAADFAYRLPRIEPHNLEKHDLRELVNRFFDVVTIQKVSAVLLLDGISLIISTIVGMMVIGFYHPFLLGFDVVLLGLILFGFFVLGRGAISTAVKESKTKYAMAAWLEELASRPHAYRLHGAPEYALNKADGLIYKYLIARKKHFRILFSQIAFALGIQAMASTALLGLGGYLVLIGQLTLGQLVAAELIVAVIVGSFAKMGKQLESFYDLLASTDKLGHVFDLKTEVDDGILVEQALPLKLLRIRNVCYQSSNPREVINNANLDINKPELVVLRRELDGREQVMLDLLYGLKQPSTGAIEFSQIDVRDFSRESLRSHITLARNIEILNETLAENVQLGRRGLTLAKVRIALETVGLIERVDTLTDGLQTKLDIHGAPLSENEQRLLMIARAIVGDPDILLLDGLLDPLPFDVAKNVLMELRRTEFPWLILLVTARDDLADLASKELNLSPQTSNSSPSLEPTGHTD